MTIEHVQLRQGTASTLTDQHLCELLLEAVGPFEHLLVLAPDAQAAYEWVDRVGFPRSRARYAASERSLSGLPYGFCYVSLPGAHPSWDVMQALILRNGRCILAVQDVPRAG